MQTIAAIRKIMYISMLLFFCQINHAKQNIPNFATWKDPTPSALQPFAGNAEVLADLAGSSLLFYTHPKLAINLPYSDGVKNYSQVPYVSGALVVSANIAQVAKVLSDYSNYKGLFPNLTQSTVLLHDKPNASTVRDIVKYHVLVKVPFPLLTFDEDVILQHELTANSISTLILNSPIQYGSGKFEWFPLSNGKTLITLTQWGDLEHPKGFLLKTMLRALPEVKLGIPSGVEGFVLESLRQRFNADTPSKAVPMANIIPAFSLNEAQEALVLKLLQGGRVVQFTHHPVWLSTSKRAEKLYFVSSFYQMPNTLAQTKEAFATPKNFPQIYRQVRKITSLEQPDGSIQSDVKVGLGLGVLSIPMHLKLNYKAESDDAIRFYSNGGDIEFIQGRLQFKALAPKSTLVTLTSAGKLGENPPLLLKLGKNLPYADYLPTVGSAPVMFEKTKAWLNKSK